jgi:hypothetical protein
MLYTYNFVYAVHVGRCHRSTCVGLEGQRVRQLARGHVHTPNHAIGAAEVASKFPLFWLDELSEFCLHTGCPAAGAAATPTWREVWSDETAVTAVRGLAIASALTIRRSLGGKLQKIILGAAG